MTEFRLEAYGPGDDRVLRYLNGAIIKETPIQHYFTLLERKSAEGGDSEAVGAGQAPEPGKTVVDLKDLVTHSERKEEAPEPAVEVKKEGRTEVNKEVEKAAEAEPEPAPPRRRGRPSLKKEKRAETPKEAPAREAEAGREGLAAEERRPDLAELERLNGLNWNIVASTICMASTLDLQKELPLEWEESKQDQSSGFATLSKIKGVFDGLEARTLDLSHTITRHESKTLKYAIFSRNEKLQEAAQKSLEMSERVLRSLELQLKYLEIVRAIRREFKVLVSHRNPVDLTSLDVDFPASFSTNVLFYDVFYTLRNDLFDYSVFFHEVEDLTGESSGRAELGPDSSAPGKDRTEFAASGGGNFGGAGGTWALSGSNLARDDVVDVAELEGDAENVWDMWEEHGASPFAPQTCLISYYESEELLTRLTFPQSVSHFIEGDYQLSVNGAVTPLYSRREGGGADEAGSWRVISHLRRARACLIDRFIFLVLCQLCYRGVKRGKYFIGVGDSRVFVKYISSKALSLVIEGEEVQVGYEPAGPGEGPEGGEERGEPIWRLLIAKARDTHVRNWKAQKFQLRKNTENPLEEFLKYAIRLIRHRRSRGGAPGA